jgi:hypothetical protein
VLLLRLEPGIDRLATEPDSAAESDVRESARPNLPVDPVDPHPEVPSDLFSLQQPRLGLSSNESGAGVGVS